VNDVQPRERHFTSRDNLRLFFEDWDCGGGGTPVLCLPGLTRNSRDFTKLARHLAPTRRVVCPDMRGRGRSQYAEHWRTYDAATYLDDIRHLLAALGLSRVVILGVSLGGLLGTAIAAAFPTVLAGLIVNDVGPDVALAGRTRILDYVGRDRPQPDWPSAVAHLKETFKTLSLQTDEDWLSFTRATYREGADGELHFDWDMSIIRPILAPPEPLPDLWALWRGVHRIPVLAIRGGASDILSPETFARMKAEKPDLVQVTLPGVGHCPSLNEPPVRKAIDDFLHQL
jgi:pimeloyl-ACP methyl ester carboxylesterase